MEQSETGGDAVKLILHIDGRPVTVENVARARDEVAFTLAGKKYAFRGHALQDGSFVLEREVSPGVWHRFTGAGWQGKGARHVQLGPLEAKISELPVASSPAAGGSVLSPRSPMPGLVRQILVSVGDRVEQGQALAVMEAMKLQMTLSAGGAAIVEAVMVREGEMITDGIELVRLKPLSAENEV